MVNNFLEPGTPSGTPETRAQVSITTTPVPESATFGLLAISSLGLLARRRS